METIALFSKLVTTKDGKKFNRYYARFGTDFKKTINVNLTKDCLKRLNKEAIDFPYEIKVTDDCYFISKEVSREGKALLNKEGKPYLVLVLKDYKDINAFDTSVLDNGVRLSDLDSGEYPF